MPSANQHSSQITQLIVDNATQTALLKETKEALAIAREDRLALWSRLNAQQRELDELRQWRAAREAAEAENEKSHHRTDRVLEVVFKVVGVLSALIGAAWALFVRGEK